MLRAHFSNGYLCFRAIPEYSEAVEISRYGSQDVHTHYRSVINVIASRVENRRSNGSLPVVSRLGFRRATAVRFGLVLFPVPAHRTGQADFPHPALGKDTRCSV